MSGFEPNAAAARAGDGHPGPLLQRVAVRRRRAQRVLLHVGGPPRGLDVAGECCGKATGSRCGSAAAGIASAVQIGTAGTSGNPLAAQCTTTASSAAGPHSSSVELDRPPLHAPHVTEPDHVLDAAQQIELPLGQGRRPAPSWAPPSRSTRNITPAASSRRNRSSSEAALDSRLGECRQPCR